METNYIENIKEDNVLQTLNFVDNQFLLTADYAFNQPFALRLSDNAVLRCEHIIRILPKKRMTVFGTFQGKPVVAKLFYSPIAPEHLAKEIAGLTLLTSNNIPTPTIYLQDINEDKKIHVLLTEHIKQACNLQECWQLKKDVQEILPLLNAMMVELATQHVFGIVQQDLHLKNFLISDKKIYTLDGSAIIYMQHLLPKKLSMDNLALFFSQFGVELIAHYESLFTTYGKARGWILKKQDHYEIKQMVGQYNAVRWLQYSRKIYRNASDFVRYKTWRSFAIVNRKYAANLQAFLQDPETFFNAPHVVLKNGRSSTVIKIKCGNKEWVVKRYNIKSCWHFLRRMWRPTRACTTWRMSHKLMLFGVPSATPIAFLEKRWFGLRSTSYAITEYIVGTNAQDFFMEHAPDALQVSTAIKNIKLLLENFSYLKMSHGDLKLNNILITPQLQPIILDLDGTHEHASLFKLKRRHRKDLKRFQQNFSEQPYLQQLIVKVL